MYVAELQPTFGQCQAGSLTNHSVHPPPPHPLSAGWRMTEGGKGGGELPKKGGLESLQI